METVLLQINDNKVYQIIKDLEDSSFVKILNKSNEPKQKLSEKYAGKLPKNIATELQNYVTQSRNEWNNQNI